MKHQRFDTRRITITAVGIAAVCVATRVLQFPIPLGYAHLGNTIILLFSVFFDSVTGAIAAGVGSALADLLSFPEWTLPTLIIKSIMGFVCSVIAHGGLRAPAARAAVRMRSARTFAAVAAAIFIMVAGYTIFGAILYGSLATGLTQIPGLVAEGIVGAILFYAVGGVLSGVFEKQRQNGGV